MGEKNVTSKKRYAIWLAVVVIALVAVGTFINPALGLAGPLKTIVFVIEAVAIGWVTFTPIAEGGK